MKIKREKQNDQTKLVDEYRTSDSWNKLGKYTSIENRYFVFFFRVFTVCIEALNVCRWFACLSVMTESTRAAINKQLVCVSSFHIYIFGRSLQTFVCAFLLFRLVFNIFWLQ